MSCIDFYFVGDTHGNTHEICRRLLMSNPSPGSVVFFLGDLCLERPIIEEAGILRQAGLQVYWIRGNHDTDTVDQWKNLAGDIDFCLDGRVVDIHGHRIAGLGGVFRKEIWLPGEIQVYQNYFDYLLQANSTRPSRDRVTKEEILSGERLNKRDLRHLSSIFPDTYHALGEQKADILIAHEGVAAIPGGFKAIDNLAQRMGVKKIFFGHHHVTQHFPADGYGCHAYCVGENEYIALRMCN